MNKVKLTYRHGNTEIVDIYGSGMFDPEDTPTEQQIYDAFFGYAGTYGFPIDVEIVSG
jgi:hypothetical protein